MLLGALIYRFVLIRVRGQALSEVIATFGIGLAILELFSYFGFVGFEYNLPVFMGSKFRHCRDLYRHSAHRHRGLQCRSDLRVMVVYPPHGHGTGIQGHCPGRAHRPDLRHRFGLDRHVERLLRCGSGAVAALFIIPLGSISPGEGYDVLIKALAVCIIGGLGSTGGVIAAAFIVGFAERFTDTYIGSHWTMIVSLVAILLVLTVKPSGLFGKQKELEERI
jgi:branched-chain amino acid transport system permease protein